MEQLEQRPTKAGTEKPEIKNLPEFLKMYEIPGQEKITAHSYERYLKNKGTNNDTIKEQIESFDRYTTKINSAPADKRALLIEEGLTNDNPRIQELAAELIASAPKDKRALLIEQGLASNNPEVQKISAHAMRFVAEDKEITSLIEQGLASNNPEVQKISAGMIKDAPEDKIDELREKVFSLIKQGITDPDPKRQETSARLIISAPEDKKTAFIEQGLANADPKIQKMYAEEIMFAPKYEKNRLEEKVFELVKQGLASEDPEAQKIYAKMIGSTWGDRMVTLIKQGLDSGNPEAQNISAGMIEDAPEDDRDELRKKVFELTKNGLSSDNHEIRRIYLWMIGFAPENRKNSLFKLAQDKLGDYFIQPPLYKNNDISKNKFKRKAFEKTGSETTLIGGELKEKTIIRHLEPEEFLIWQKLYEDHEMWREKGFDYVPIEPIQSFKLNKRGLVDVCSGVLDLNFGDWKDMSDQFVTELEKDREKIMNVLKEVDIEHGHPHNGNFCLRFFRDKDGHVDFNKKPRLYLIDFDQAVST